MPADRRRLVGRQAPQGAVASMLRGLVILAAVGPLAAAASEAPFETPITEGDRDHWSYRPIARPAVPPVANTAWPRNPVDRFILAPLEDAGLEPLPEASRVTLIRRVTFDLTGLPPTPAEVERFEHDASPQAYEALVDRLLASDAYGARWAQHWLDLARFAETDGFEHDLIRPNAWRYRDWVIDALNADRPWGEFIRWQIAGDVLRPDDQQAVVATGFLLCGPDMPDINLQQERRHNFLNDMTSTVGAAFLGLQIGCAQCHDHKYDAISQLDFYRLRACFENAEIFSERTIATPAEQAEHERRVAEHARQIKALEAEVEQLEQRVLERVRQQRGAAELRLNSNELLEHFTDEEHRRRVELTADLEQLRKRRLPELPMGRVTRERRAEREPARLWLRGDFQRPGPVVEPAFPRIANPNELSATDVAAARDETSARAALALWLTRPDNPLTARVLANRLWQHHFVRGLSNTPSDFGIIGDEPTHPELLDWLAAELLAGATPPPDSGSQSIAPHAAQSFKHIHRLLVTSATYRQASRPTEPGWSRELREQSAAAWERALAADPDNQLLSRMRRRRLEGEAIRDTLLAVAGRLSQRRGGPGVRPPLPEELVSTLLKNQWPVTPEADDHDRRSIYLFVRRNLRYPLFEVFDQPDTNASCPRRNRSTIAPQALVLLNSEVSLSAARALAGRVLNTSDAGAGRQVELCYRLALGREPTSSERDLAVDFVERTAARLRLEGREARELALPPDLPQERDPYHAAALTDFCLALFNLNEFIYID